MNRFVVLLRGINVGGNKKVPMAVLSSALSKAGFAEIQTLLASGNIVLSSAKSSTKDTKKAVEEVIVKTFGFSSNAIVRSFTDIEKLVKADPFKGIRVTKDMRLYVTFLENSPKSSLTIPWSSPSGDFKILSVSRTEVCSILDISKGSRTIDSMAILEKEFGKTITTRNWNTIQKIASV